MTSYSLPKMNDLLAEMREYKDYCSRTLEALLAAQAQLQPNFQGALADVFYSRLNDADDQLKLYTNMQMKVADMVGRSTLELQRKHNLMEDALRGKGRY